ncbi:MAG: hypothetical protein KDD06_18720 [Phaeodactylibacter sp.]|nr:hypothetical protein [Phaeodactylibacter sp.]MCB9265969.1 hypothetical protein [Lewinellaceae bacterium]MCB9290241.1 hypothetical protein [Lewinellaceae bacterium]
MLLKWFFTGLIIYALYKYFFGPNALGSGRDEQSRQPIDYEQPPRKKDSSQEEDEYIDYEEVD